MNPINATLHVEASADWIWALITHFAKYENWNRLVPALEGEPQLNARLRLKLAPAERRPIVLKARVKVAARNRELRWCAGSRLPKLLKIEHGFRIEQRAGSCRLYHTLSCSGWLANERLIDGLRQAFEATNAALVASAAMAATVPPAPIVALPSMPFATRPRALTLRAG
jgi:hypothetical protein